jgi:hypothetical protein
MSVYTYRLSPLEADFAVERVVSCIWRSAWEYACYNVKTFEIETHSLKYNFDKETDQIYLEYKRRNNGVSHFIVGHSLSKDSYLYAFINTNSTYSITELIVETYGKQTQGILGRLNNVFQS